MSFAADLGFVSRFCQRHSSTNKHFGRNNEIRTIFPDKFDANFGKVDPEDTTTYDVPYDYRSVMHYDKSSFAIDGKSATMLPVDHAYDDIIGNGETATAGDWIKINRIYQCPRYIL